MRVPSKDLKAYPWYLKPFFWNQRRKYGRILKPALLWARVPKLFATVALLYGALDSKNSPISPALRYLVTVRVSKINWCNFCIDINSFMFSKRTGELDKLEQLSNWKESDLFSDKEKSVLEYTDAVTLSDRQVSDEMVNDLKKYFDDDGIIELTGLIAFQNLSSKFNSALDVPAQGFCQISPDKNND